MSELLKSIAPSVILTRKGNILSSSDPMGELESSGLVVRVGNGLFVFRGELARLINKVEALIQKMTQDLLAEEIHVPSLLSEENMKSSEYLSSFWNQAIVLKNNESQGPKQIANGAVLGIACPTVCYHYFASLRGKAVANSELVTSLSRCSRHEEGELSDLSRLTNFTMREIIGLGSEKFCASSIRRIEEAFLGLLNETLDLQYDMRTASDPFFGSGSLVKQKAQLVTQSKMEVHAALPHKDTTTGVASFNRHGNVFFRRFGISQVSEEKLESFCVGFGYERIVFAIVSQKGTDFSKPYYRSLL
jgi:hypothetical protein